jgi:SAM-dependent methyltransferase
VDAELRDRTLRLVEELLSSLLDAGRARELAAELEQRRDELGTVLTEGVNPPRTDYGQTWEDARAAAYAPTERVGAVHLELGTWTAFPPERVQEFVDGDGLAEFIRLDADPQYECEVVADATALPFRSGVIDRVGSNSTLEHIAHPARVLREAHRVLRPGGVFVTATPFVWHEHGYPDDYLRLARGYYERVLVEAGFTDVTVDRDGSSGLYYTLHNAAKMALLDESQPEHEAMARLQELVVVLLGTLIPLDRYFTSGARYWYHSVRVLARKPGTYEPSRRQRDPARPFAERALDLLADPDAKQPLRREGNHLVCDATGAAYPLIRSGAVNLLEPERLRPSLARRAAARARTTLFG